MNFKTTIALLVLLLLIGGYLKFFALETKPTDPDLPGNEDQSLITGILPDMVTGLEVEQRIDGKTQPRVTLERTKDSWTQAAPVRFPLNAWAANDLLIVNALKLTYTQSFTPGESDMPPLSEIKLAPPIASITLATKEKTHTIKLGKTVTGSRGYAMLDDDPKVYVVSDELHKVLLEQTIGDWREKKLPAPTIAGSEAITLAHGEETIVAQRRSGNWQVSNRVDGESVAISRADERAISDWLLALETLSITQFAEDLAGLTDAERDARRKDFGLDKPKLIMQVALAGVDGVDNSKRPIRTLRVGGPVDLSRQYFFATWSDENTKEDVVFEVELAHIEKLTVATDTLRDPRLTPVTVQNIKRFEVAKPGKKSQDGSKEKPIVLLKTTDGWALPGADDKEPVSYNFDADRVEAAALVASVAGALAVAYVPDVKVVGDPVATITMKGIGNVSETLRVYPASQATPKPQKLAVLADGAFVVLRNDETAGYVLPVEKLDRVLRPAIALRERTVLDTKPSLLHTLTITRPGGEVFSFRNATPALPLSPEAAANAKPSWRLVGHPQFEERAFADLLSELLPLRAEQWLDESPRVTGITVAFDVGLGEPTVVTIDPVSRKALLKRNGIQLFRVSASLVALLQGEYRNRTLLPFNADALSKVTVTTGPDSLTIERDGKRYISRQVKKVNQANAARLFDTLAGLRVVRYRFAMKPEPKRLLRMHGQAANGMSFLITLYDAKDADGDHLCSATGTLGENELNVWFTINDFTLQNMVGQLIEQP